ncbi:hypothetical protein DY000_02009008 [Brassica cretica]|uniref:Xylanase inhibitor C-terminal domain-containing protein n=1 Tax=Brassica cretica TaxID=69181 RepID=A0ABQ7BRM6_BRACR|nr:hypothetical protein DY000_02009008 [Brassica cretica]
MKLSGPNISPIEPDHSFVCFLGGDTTVDALFVDLEPTVINEVCAGTYRQLFPPGQLISWNNFVEGYYTVGKGIVDLCLDGVIELAGNDSHLQVFFGFWFRISVFERLFVDYGHKSKLGTTSYPLVSTAAIKPNNTVRLPHSLLGKSLHFTKFCELNVAVVNLIIALFGFLGGDTTVDALFVDLEPTVINEVCAGTYRQLFPPEQLISWNNFSEGYYTVGNDIVDLCLDGVIELADNYSRLQVSTAAIKPNNTVCLPHSLLGKSLHFTKFCKLNVAVVVR